MSRVFGVPLLAFGDLVDRCGEILQRFGWATAAATTKKAREQEPIRLATRL
jgi:hypothetical protein